MSGWKRFCCLCANNDKQSGITYRRYSRQKEKRGKNSRSSGSVTLTRKSLLESEQSRPRQMIPMHIVESKYTDENHHQGSGVRLLDSPKSKKRRKIQDVFSEMPDGSHFRSDKIMRLENPPHYFVNSNQQQNQNNTNRNVATTTSATHNNGSIMFSSLPVEGFKGVNTSQSESDTSGFIVRSFSPNTSFTSEFHGQNTSGSHRVSTNTSRINTSPEADLRSIRREGSTVTSRPSHSQNMNRLQKDNTSYANQNSHGNNAMKLSQTNGMQRHEHHPDHSFSSNQSETSNNPALMRRVSPRTGMLSFPASKQNRNIQLQPKSKSDVGRQSKPAAKQQKTTSMTYREDGQRGKVESMYGYVPRAVQDVYASKALEGNKLDDFFLHCHNERELDKFAHPYGDHGYDLEIGVCPDEQSTKVPETLAAIFEPSSPSQDSVKPKYLQHHSIETGNDVNGGNDVVLGVNNLHIGGGKHGQTTQELVTNGHPQKGAKSEDGPGSHQTSHQPILNTVPSLSSFVLDIQNNQTGHQVDLDKSLEVMWDTKGEVLY